MFATTRTCMISDRIFVNRETIKTALALTERKTPKVAFERKYLGHS
jgi:hypothetical protein